MDRRGCMCYMRRAKSGGGAIMLSKYIKNVIILQSYTKSLSLSSKRFKNPSQYARLPRTTSPHTMVDPL
jgi:hypothetical protein